MKRYDQVVFGCKSKIVDYKVNQVRFGASVTDDSHFVPRVKQVRDFIASGGAPSSDLRYDSQIDKNVKVPKLNRSVTIDPVDADNAAKVIINEAKEKADKQSKAEAEKQLRDSLNQQSEFLNSLKDSASDKDSGSD